MGEVTLRIITLESGTKDLERLVELGKALDEQEKKVSALSDVDALRGYEGWLTTPERMLEGQTVLGAFDGDVMLGFVSGKKVEGYLGDVGIISLIYVDYTHQFLGVGRMLIDGLLKELGKVTHVTLDVFTGNEGAIEFYKSLGFKPYMFTMGMNR